ncbi:MAG: GNAT family N-acetyltransferase [Candidatus Coatesbacteria bacterium]|nr:MAG: GNAT family N-acetyltransferase [Candidatus Coatesbacteria bacterium]
MTSYKIKPFNEEHSEDAARLFAERFGMEREHVSLLPTRFEDFRTVLPLLNNLVVKSPGVIAVGNDGLVGFLIGRLLPSWRGGRSVWVPEWANAVAGRERREVFQRMYASLAYEWVANGCFTHLISTLAHDEDVLDELFWLGFGMVAVDAMRGLGDVEGPFADVEIRRAAIRDLEVAESLSHEQERYMATSPILMALVEKSRGEFHKEILSNPAQATWLASYKGEVVSGMRIGPSTQDAAYIITDERTASITAAFTKEHVRCKGIGATLLQHSLDWAKSEGYERCAVDFEPENVLARSFWLRRFKPVSFSLVRQVDRRIAWAHSRRKDEHFW